MNAYHDPFFCVPRTPYTTQRGSVDLPILYQECTAVLAFFGCVGDQDRRTIIQTRGGGRFYRAGKIRLRLGASPHPMAGRLRRLALDGARPLAVWASTRFQSRLNAGAPLVSRQSASIISTR